MKKLVKNIFFLVLTVKIKFSSNFIIISVISASKYVGTAGFKLISGKSFSGVYPILVIKFY